MKLVKEYLYESNKIFISDHQLEDFIQMMEGSEINSIEYGGMVYIQNGIAYKAFLDEPIKLDKEGWGRLWIEYIKTELTD